MTMTEQQTTTQVYRVYIKATPQQIWDAITQPEWTERFGYGGRADYDLRPGGPFVHYTSDDMKKAGLERGYTVPDVGVDGEVLEVDPPRRLVQTWRMCMDDNMKAEGFTKLTYEIDEVATGGTRLTIVHELANAPGLSLVLSGSQEEFGAGGGWPWVLSSLKSLLETGSGLSGESTDRPS
ncbi:MAG TPA: SRPBCC family protein [Acidimicrobiales bacterium]|nr:SRPBCC family protein [Acidimicrobiales bacterium]